MEQLEAEADSEVEVEFRAIGDVREVLAEYADYMKREMPHVNRISPVELGRFGDMLERIEASDFNAHWRFEVADVPRWGGFDDEVFRAVLVRNCRGDSYAKALDAAKKLAPHALPFQHEDVVLYAFIRRFVVDGSSSTAKGINLKSVFNLDRADHVVLLFDSCSFDPRKPGGDALYIDIRMIAERIETVRAVLDSSVKIEARGRFENVSTDEEEEEGETSGGSDLDDFVVADDQI